MRKSHSWFTDRAWPMWSSMPGRSFMVLSPHGVRETEVAEILAQAVETQFKVPRQYPNAKARVFRISPDTATSSQSFVKRILSQLDRVLAKRSVFESLNDPSELLEDIIGEAIANDIYPVLVIERFHSFVRIADDHLLSVLASLRTLEHSASVTTIAIAPFTYNEMRRMMSPSAAFVNSAYGDNHDRAVVSPLSREEFLTAGVARGIQKPLLNKYFTRVGGGPDVVFQALLDCLSEGEEGLVEQIISRIGDHVECFLDEVLIGMPSRDILSRMVLGIPEPMDEQCILQHPFKDYLVSARPAARAFVVSTPVLGRIVLRKSLPQIRIYEDSLLAFDGGRFELAARLLDGIESSNGRLAAYKSIVMMVHALTANVDVGLLGVEWVQVRQLSKALINNSEVGSFINGWAAKLYTWSGLVEVSAAGGREQLDRITSMAADHDAESMLIYLIGSYLKKCRSLSSPTARVRAMTNIPEAILQSLAISRCGVDFNAAPADFEAVDYQEFFAQLSTFNLPAVGRKMDLTCLLVVVPAILKNRSQGTNTSNVLMDVAYMKGLQSKLVERLRNTASHTIAKFDRKDAEYLEGVSDQLLEAWILLSGRAMSDIAMEMPTLAMLTGLLYGEDFGNSEHVH